MDLQGIRLWALERFGKINFGFLGTPQGQEQVDVRPLRPGVVMETYHYRPEKRSQKPPVLYLATYGNFSEQDDALCCAIAEAGYDVYGMDPLRYLLHAAAQERLEVPALWQDLQRFNNQLHTKPLLIGQPVSAGLALLWASGVESVQGVIAIGRTQLAFKPRHIFKNENPHTFFLSRYVHKIGPRPISFVFHAGHTLGGDRDEMSALYQTSTGPRQIDQVKEITAEFLLEQLQWLQKQH